MGIGVAVACALFAAAPGFSHSKAPCGQNNINTPQAPPDLAEGSTTQLNFQATRLFE
jgi:hypothetical protein